MTFTEAFFLLFTSKHFSFVQFVFDIIKENSTWWEGLNTPCGLLSLGFEAALSAQFTHI